MNNNTTDYAWMHLDDIHSTINTSLHLYFSLRFDSLFTNFLISGLGVCAHLRTEGTLYYTFIIIFSYIRECIQENPGCFPTPEFFFGFCGEGSSSELLPESLLLFESLPESSSRARFFFAAFTRMDQHVDSTGLIRTDLFALRAEFGLSGFGKVGHTCHICPIAALLDGFLPLVSNTMS